VCVSVCVSAELRLLAATARASMSTEPRLQARHISLHDEGHALYPVLSSLVVVVVFVVFVTFATA